MNLPEIIRKSTWKTPELRESAAKLVEVILKEAAPSWEEVTVCRGDQPCWSYGQQPDVFIVRDSQMYRLIWPQLPPPDEALNATARPDLSKVLPD
jgi:hypothetical protein